MRALLRAVVASALPLGAAFAELTSPDTDGQFSFHHLPLNDSQHPFLLQFYERLFDPSTTRRRTIGTADASESGPMLLLISQGSSERQFPTALWHFGWGGASLGEPYLAHARREVVWEPPVPVDRLHMHVRSVAPAAAATWYRDVHGLRVEMDLRVSRTSNTLPPPEHRVPAALVWMGSVGVLIYRTEPPLLSTLGQRIDHVALAVRGESSDGIRPAMHPRATPTRKQRASGTPGGRRCSFLKYRPDILGRRALPTGRLACLGARRYFHHGLLGCRDLDAALTELRKNRVTVLAEPSIIGDLRTAMIEGPDRIAIEIVEIP